MKKELKSSIKATSKGFEVTIEAKAPKASSILKWRCMACGAPMKRGNSIRKLITCPPIAEPKMKSE